MSELPVIDPAVQAAAVHGSWCPKLCNHACPVLAATGRNEAVPWGFHRTVADLADGRSRPAEAAAHLQDCTGCLGCQVPCAFDQDVPAQVRAGRAAVAAAGSPLPALADVQAAVARGESPYGVASAPTPDAGGTAELVVLIGCRDTADSIDAVDALYRAAGVDVAFVAAEGCCGATLRDLGDDGAADVQRTGVRERVAGRPVVALDPHCLAELGEHALDVSSSLAALADEGRLAFDDGAGGAVTYHDPCLLARAAEPVIQPPRALLRAAGYELLEPEGHGAETVCAGAGMAYELVDADAAEAVATRRRAQLAATGAATVATGCAGARHRLAADGDDVEDLFTLLARRLRRTP